jgi:DoxX-like family
VEIRPAEKYWQQVLVSLPILQKRWELTAMVLRMSEARNDRAATPNAREVFSCAHIFSRSGKRAIAYWIFTLLVVFENAAGFLWAFLHIDYLRVMLAHLGYPQYFMNIMGAWQLAAAAALIAPGFPLVKEWAYAGVLFNYSSALISHLSVGDGPRLWIPALIFAVFTVCSWLLRPSDRRLSSRAPATQTSIWAWIVPVIILGLMLVVARLTLPQPPKF